MVGFCVVSWSAAGRLPHTVSLCDLYKYTTTSYIQQQLSAIASDDAQRM